MSFKAVALFFGAFLLSLAFSRWVLPWFGIQTCMSGGCPGGSCPASFDPSATPGQADR